MDEFRTQKENKCLTGMSSSTEEKERERERS